MVMKDYLQFEIRRENDEIQVEVVDLWETTTIDSVTTWEEDLFDTLDELYEKYNNKTIIFKSWGRVV